MKIEKNIEKRMKEKKRTFTVGLKLKRIAGA